MNEKIAGEASPNANLETLKKQAKRLLKQCKEGSPHALSRVKRAGLSESIKSDSLKLTDAQRVIARENGCGDWKDLKKVATSDCSFQNLSGTREIEITGIDQIWLDCTDIEKADTFYSGILGMKKTGMVPGMMCFFECGGTALTLGLSKSVRQNSILYFNVGNAVSDIQRAYNALKAKGVAVGDSPHCIAENWNGCDVWVAFFKDPFGNQLAFKCNAPVTTSEEDSSG